GAFKSLLPRTPAPPPSQCLKFPLPSAENTGGIMRFDIHRMLPGAIVCLVALAGAAPSSSAAASLNVIYSFCQKTNCQDGDQPYGGVMLDSSGQLLGTTGFGGKYNGGT